MNITYDDFLKCDIRTGTITSATPVPKSNKLLMLQVSFGEEIGTRTIMAGIAKDFTPEAIIGTKIVAVVNLEPRKLMGVQSHGMLLATHSEEKLFLVGFNSAGPVDGSKVG